jgi:tetratricopeptide (TPR) repeat protein
MKIGSSLIKRGVGVLLAATLAGCGYLAVQSATPKRAATVRTDAAVRTDALFWQTLHTGDYDNIGTALNALEDAYLADPSDAVTAAHIGWMHIWRLSERARLDNAPPTITDDALLARRYFQEAVDLNPHDARYLGFLASTILAEGSIHKDEKLTRRGYYLLLDSIDAWPEFNLFTAGYVLSPQPSDSPRFKEALEWQWRTLDVCSGEKLNRADPSFAKYMAQATTEGKKRVCWNSWIAPHNFEGFFLNMGDMLVKAGDWQTAQKIYANAKLPATYEKWKFRDVLEQRIMSAQTNVAVFNAAQPGADRIQQRLMIATPFSCMGCHQQ